MVFEKDNKKEKDDINQNYLIFNNILKDNTPKSYH